LRWVPSYPALTRWAPQGFGDEGLTHFKLVERYSREKAVDLGIGGFAG
jgi:hypothetical protein